MSVEIVETKQRIIEAASLAMIAKSYNGVGLNEILQAADVPKGSFYHFFKSKENLGIAVIEKAAADHLQIVRSYFSDRARTPLERLRKYYESVRDEAAADRAEQCVVCKLALEQANLSEPMRAAIRCSFDQSRSMTAQLLREAQAAGEVSKEYDAEQLADFLMVSLDGAMIGAEVNDDVKSIDNFLRFMFGVVLK